MKTLKERIEVEQAFLDGSPLQYGNLKRGDWRDLFDALEYMVFDWRENDYRIKPEPMEGYINIFGGDKLGFPTKEAAEARGHEYKGIFKTIKVREVT